MAISFSPAVGDAVGSGDWDELRREARRLEGELDVRLSSYAKLGGYSGPRSCMSDTHWKSMEMEIETLLDRLANANEAMSRCAAAATPTTSVTQKLTRHRDILHEFTQELRRTRGNIMSIRENAELLSSVRNDIDEYKASGMQSVPNLLRERAAIHGSITQIDEVTNQAEAVKGVLAAQKTAFGEIQGKVKQLSDRFPVIRSLLGLPLSPTTLRGIDIKNDAALLNCAAYYANSPTYSCDEYCLGPVTMHIDNRNSSPYKFIPSILVHSQLDTYIARL